MALLDDPERPKFMVEAAANTRPMHGWEKARAALFRSVVSKHGGAAAAGPHLPWMGSLLSPLIRGCAEASETTT
jgi:hypothetical protein